MDTSFSLHNNAKRAAERMIRAGTAPSIDYGLRTREDGRIEIVWKTGERPGMHCAEAEAAPTAIETELAAEMLEKVQAEGWPGPDADGKDGEHEDEVDKAIARERIAEIEEHPEHLITGPALAGANGGESSRAANDPAESDSAATAPPPRPATAAASAAAGAEQDPELAGFETPRLIGELQRRGYRTAQARQSRTQRPARGQRMSKAAELDEAAARGVMPTKPDVTSPPTITTRGASTSWPNWPRPATGTRWPATSATASTATPR